jgi:hypothetical protein
LHNKIIAELPRLVNRVWNYWGSGMSLMNAIGSARVNTLGNSTAGQTNGLAIYGAVDMFWQP